MYHYDEVHDFEGSNPCMVHGVCLLDNSLEPATLMIVDRYLICNEIFYLRIASLFATMSVVLY